MSLRIRPVRHVVSLERKLVREGRVSESDDRAAGLMAFAALRECGKAPERSKEICGPLLGSPTGVALALMWAIAGKHDLLDAPFGKREVAEAVAGIPVTLDELGESIGLDAFPTGFAPGDAKTIELAILAMLYAPAISAAYGNPEKELAVANVAAVWGEAWGQRFLRDAECSGFRAAAVGISGGSSLLAAVAAAPWPLVAKREFATKAMLAGIQGEFLRHGLREEKLFASPGMESSFSSDLYLGRKKEDAEIGIEAALECGIEKELLAYVAKRSDGALLQEKIEKAKAKIEAKAIRQSMRIPSVKKRVLKSV